jgi:hypothetical protein
MARQIGDINHLLSWDGRQDIYARMTEFAQISRLQCSSHVLRTIY